MIINIIKIILPLFFLLFIEVILVYLLIQINTNNELDLWSKLSVSFFIFLASFASGYCILQSILNEYYIINIKNKHDKYDKNIKNKKIIHLLLLHDRNNECPICLEKIDYKIFPQLK